MAENSGQPVAGSIASLVDALQHEHRQYDRLLGLIRQQGQLMINHDLDGLQDSAQRLAACIAQADAARQEREHLAGELMRSCGGPRQTASLTVWVQVQESAVRRLLDGPIRAVRRAADELQRANELNRRLANFCLDLVEEEAAVLRRCLLDDPAGCYDRGAQPTRNSNGGVMQHKA